MRVLAKFVLAFGFVFALSVQAHAEALFNSLISAGITTQNDASVSVVTHGDGTALGPNEAIAVGDVVTGILRINNTTSTPAITLGANQQLAYVFSAQVATLTGPTTVGTQDFYNTSLVLPTSTATRVSTLLPGLGISSSAVVAIVENGNATNPTTNSTLASSLATINSTYALDGSLGLGGAGNGFTGQLRVPTGTPLSPSALTGLGQNTPIGDDTGAFNVLQNNVAAGPFLPLSLTSATGSGKLTGAFTFSAQLIIPDSTQIGNGYVVGDHSIVSFAGVPEPTSLTLFFLGSVGFGIVARRRQKRQLAA